jgi:hypothetical protein
MGTSPCNARLEFIPYGDWEVSGASMQARRTLMRVPLSITVMVSPSPMDRTDAA